MKLKKWTVKQVIFEREMNNPDDSIHFNGFKLPKDKDFLLAVLEELYEQYGDDRREINLKDLDGYLKDGVRYVELRVCGKRIVNSSLFVPDDTIVLYTKGKYYYPDKNELTFISFSGWLFDLNKKSYHPKKYELKGYHIHKHCLINPLTGR